MPHNSFGILAVSGKENLPTWLENHIWYFTDGWRRGYSVERSICFFQDKEAGAWNFPHDNVVIWCSFIVKMCKWGRISRCIVPESGLKINFSSMGQENEETTLNNTGDTPRSDLSTHPACRVKVMTESNLWTHDKISGPFPKLSCI